jgi:hypothetical protein
MEKPIENTSKTQVVDGACGETATAYIRLSSPLEGHDIEVAEGKHVEVANPKFTISNEEYEGTGRQYLRVQDSCQFLVVTLFLIGFIIFLGYF